MGQLKQDLRVALDAMSLRGYQDDPDRWADLTDEDKRALKLFGFGVWAAFMLIVQLEILGF